jgi:hypothetical protein
MTAAPAFAQPKANEGYCIGIAPENCYYALAQTQGRLTYQGVPQSEIVNALRGARCAWQPASGSNPELDALIAA